MDQRQAVSIPVSRWLLHIASFIISTSACILEIHYNYFGSELTLIFFKVFPIWALVVFVGQVLVMMPPERLRMKSLESSVAGCFLHFVFAHFAFNYNVHFGILLLALGHKNLIEGFSQRLAVSVNMLIFVHYISITTMAWINVPNTNFAKAYYISIPLTTFYKSLARVKLSPQRVACVIGCFLILCSEFLYVSEMEKEFFSFLFPNFAKEAAALMYYIGLLGIALVVVPESTD